MELCWYHYLIAIFGSFIAGIINTLAGNGSVITLSILTEMLGLPPNLANGTNRIGVVTGSLASAIAFYKNGKLNFERSNLYIIPTIIGAILGVLVAVWVSNEQFKAVFQYLMLAMLIMILVKPERWIRETDTKFKSSIWLSIPVFLALGFYGGFIQMGMGVFYLAAMVFIARYNIMEGNAVKAFVVAVYTLLAVAIFHYKGLINWELGLLLAVGQTLGGWYTATYASKNKKVEKWAYWILVIVVIAAILNLFGVFQFLFSR